MNKNLIPLGIFSALVAFLAIGLTLNPKDVPSPLVGKPAASLNLPQLESGELLAKDALKDQIWILNIWASWCLSCEQEHQVFNALAQKIAGQPIKLVGLNYKDTPLEAKAWLNKLGNPYHIVLEDLQGKATIDWGVYGVPETFVIDQQGIIRHKFTGPVTQEAVDNTLIPLLISLKEDLQ